MRFYRCSNCGNAENLSSARCLACGARRERIVNRVKGQIWAEDADGNRELVYDSEHTDQLELMP